MKMPDASELRDLDGGRPLTSQGVESTVHTQSIERPKDALSLRDPFCCERRAKATHHR